jgi:hypothetical protein
MNRQLQIVHGGVRNGDYDAIHRLAKLKKESRWACGKNTKAGDVLLIYFLQPHSEIIASSVALKDAQPGNYWPFMTRIGKIRLLSSPITLAEMKEMFPRWKWLNYPRSKQYLDKAKAAALLKRAGLKLKTPPIAVKVSGGGFGKPEQNRLVEQAACKAVCNHFTKRGYIIISREKENVGYDFDVTRKNEMIHVEVKGISGSALKFQITANEVACAKTDSKFRLAVVTEATTPQKKVHFFSRKVFLKSFELTPLAYFAAVKKSLLA